MKLFGSVKVLVASKLLSGLLEPTMASRDNFASHLKGNGTKMALNRMLVEIHHDRKCLVHVRFPYMGYVSVAVS